MSCKTGRSLNEKLEIEVAEIIKLDRCKMTVVLIERFRSEYFLRKDLQRLLRDQAKTQSHLLDDYYARKV